MVFLSANVSPLIVLCGVAQTVSELHGILKVNMFTLCFSILLSATELSFHHQSFYSVFLSFTAKLFSVIPVFFFL